MARFLREHQRGVPLLVLGCRAFATRMNGAGAPIRAIQQALGLSMAETTFKYLFLSEAQAKMMADYASLPAPAARSARTCP